MKKNFYAEPTVSDIDNEYLASVTPYSGNDFLSPVFAPKQDIGSSYEPNVYPVSYGQPVSSIQEEPVFSDDMPVFNPPVLQDYSNPDWFEEPVLNPRALPIREYVDDQPIGGGLDLFMEPDYPPYKPDVDYIYIPKFPDFSLMSCSQLQAEIEDLNQTLITSKLVSEVRSAYENALSTAQNLYIKKCGKNVADVCPEPQLPAPPQGKEWVKSAFPLANGCPQYELIDYRCPMPSMDVAEGYKMIVVGKDENGCDIWNMVRDTNVGTGSGSGSGTGGSGVGSGTGSGSTGVKTNVGTGSGVGSGGTGTGSGSGVSGGGFVDDKKSPASLPTTPVSKNLQPYIYAGLGIVVILIVSRMLTKKS